jgi:DNA-3-methyladenine glycosylase I
VSTYCEVAPGHPVHDAYHEHEYGVPSRDDAVICERLALEIFQAGLSWELVLRRREGIRAAFGGFAPVHVAGLGDEDRARLVADVRLIRNRRKIDAIITNAGVMCGLIDQYGSVAEWLDAHHPRERPEWVRLFGGTFRFTGPEVTNEFLMSLGYLPGAHAATCPVYSRIVALGPPWRAAERLPSPTKDPE